VGTGGARRPGAVSGGTRGQVMWCVRRLPSRLFGLKYNFTLAPYFNDEEDRPLFFHGLEVPVEVSAWTRERLRHEIEALGARCRCIMEVGVHRNGDLSATTALVRYKPPGCVYLGVDIEDKSYLNDPANNVFTLQCRAEETDRVTAYSELVGCGSFDLIFLDGCHSVSQVQKEWWYAGRLSKHGVMVLHCTNAHPGPKLLFDAVDSNLFDKTQYCSDCKDDWGMAVVRRR
jgi:hypothetical protein